jgi:hypothetical protein
MTESKIVTLWKKLLNSTDDETLTELSILTTRVLVETGRSNVKEKGYTIPVLKPDEIHTILYYD